VGLGNLVGMGPDVALTLALSRRVRDVIVYGPGLLAWQGRWSPSAPRGPLGSERRERGFFLNNSIVPRAIVAGSQRA